MLVTASDSFIGTIGIIETVEDIGSLHHGYVNIHSYILPLSLVHGLVV